MTVAMIASWRGAGWATLMVLFSVLPVTAVCGLFDVSVDGAMGALGLVGDDLGAVVGSGVPPMACVLSTGNVGTSAVGDDPLCILP